MAIEGWSSNACKIGIGGNPSILDVYRLDSKRRFGEAPQDLLLIPMAGSERIPLQTLGKMGKYCHPKITGGLGAKEYFSLLLSTCGKMWMETIINFQPVDRSYHTKVFAPSNLIA